MRQPKLTHKKTQTPIVAKLTEIEMERALTSQLVEFAFLPNSEIEMPKKAQCAL